MENSKKTLKTIQVSEENDLKDPRLKFRYSKGLGDILACFLHSKPISWLTVIITGKKKPCTKCWIRANALNVLCPIPLWKFYFKNEEDLLDTFIKDMEAYGFYAEKEDGNVSFMKATIPKNSENIEFDDQSIEETINIDNQKDKILKDYILLTSGDSFVENLLIRTEVYKKK